MDILVNYTYSCYPTPNNIDKTDCYGFVDR